MLKNTKKISLILTISILICLLSSSFFLLGDTNKIHGVVPTKVTAHCLYRNIQDSNGNLLGTYTSYLEFWNVGDYGDGEQTDVTEHLVYHGERYYEHGIEGWVEDGYSYDKTGWKFSGGPNGKFEYWGSAVVTMHIEDGTRIVYDPGQSGWSVEPYIIDNPGAFDGWTEEAGDSEGSVDSTGSVDSNYTQPSISLLILDGPVSLGDEKVSYTIQAQVTGNPEPRVEFSGVSQDRIISTGTPNVVKIDLNQNETLNLTATATNNIGSATASINLMGSLLSAPAINLSVKGPVADEDEKYYSFIIEAKVTGNPAPQVNFNRDDSGGSLGTNKAMIRLASDSEFTVTATALNSQGSASSSVTLSTQNAVPELELKVIEGPVWLNIEIAYYVVQAQVKGFPAPVVVWDNPSKTYFIPYGKNKKIVYVRDEKFSDITIYAYATNELGKTEKKSVNLKWEAPPEGTFAKRVFTVFDGAEGKGGDLMVKRADSREWVLVTGSMTLYEGDSIKTQSKSAIIIASNIKNWICLDSNSEFMVQSQEDGNHILVRQGKIRFNLKNEPGQKPYMVDGSFGSASIKGTDFIVTENGTESGLEVIEGQVEYISNVSGDPILINASESIGTNENGFTQKQNFDLNSEKKYWESFSLIPDSNTLRENSGGFISNIQNSLNEGIIPGSLIAIVVSEVILLFVVLVILVVVILRNRAR